MTGRTRRGVRATAVATAAMAALTASQGPGTAASAGQRGPEHAQGPSVTGDSTYRTELPPLRVPGAGGARERQSAGTAAPASVGALPATVFAAYRAAESELARSAPGCGLRWQLLAAIGQVESGQARGGRVSADGTTLTPILGPRLDGNGFALIRDTDGGRHDGDTAYDRAVGPLQFIPSTWANWGADGNGDGLRDPGNVFDAALAAGRYLCAGGRDLSAAGDLDRALLGYNHSTAYLLTVRAWFAYYLDGHSVVPDRGAAGEPQGEVRPSPARTPSAEPTASGAKPPAPTPSRSSSPPASRSASPSPSPSSSPTEPAGTTGPAEPVPSLPVPVPVVPGATVPTALTSAD
ncbi:lytic transglycosylase domain-containing protein [Streptomyces sp. NPDC015127]|uniref:lytic transglycosylase domain-containing protein n=1 Tax=Streptomyces sp. NPDC015127 TaxID=3364939 RepID=UPI0036FA01E6